MHGPQGSRGGQWENSPANGGTASGGGRALVRPAAADVPPALTSASGHPQAESERAPARACRPRAAPLPPRHSHRHCHPRRGTGCVRRRRLHWPPAALHARLRHRGCQSRHSADDVHTCVAAQNSMVESCLPDEYALCDGNTCGGGQEHTFWAASLRFSTG